MCLRVPVRVSVCLCVVRLFYERVQVEGAARVSNHVSVLNCYFLCVCFSPCAPALPDNATSDGNRAARNANVLTKLTWDACLHGIVSCQWALRNTLCRCGKQFRLYDVLFEDGTRMPTGELISYYYLHKHRRLLWRRNTGETPRPLVPLRQSPSPTPVSPPPSTKSGALWRRTVTRQHQRRGKHRGGRRRSTRLLPAATRVTQCLVVVCRARRPKRGIFTCRGDRRGRFRREQLGWQQFRRTDARAPGHSENAIG